MKHRKFYCKNYIECSGNLPKYQPKDCEEQCHSCMDEIIEHHFNKKRKMETLNFGQALEAVKTGTKISREGWNGKGMFLIYIDPYLNNQFSVTEKSEIVGTLSPYLGMKTADNKLVPWLASQTDILADDWGIVA